MHGYVAPRIGHLRLTRLNSGHLRALHGELLASGGRRGSGGLSTRTVVYTHRLLSHALSDAVRWGLLTENPADKVDASRLSHGRRREASELPPGQLTDAKYRARVWHLVLGSAASRIEALR
jgi:hypothetical protein